MRSRPLFLAATAQLASFAAMNGDASATLEVPLDFPGAAPGDWRLREFADGTDPGAPETVVETTRDLGNTRKLTLRLQPGGGYAAVLTPAAPGTKPDSNRQ